MYYTYYILHSYNFKKKYVDKRQQVIDKNRMSYISLEICYQVNQTKEV